MKPRKPHYFVPRPGGSIAQHYEAEGPTTYHVPMPAKATRLKFDRATGTFVVDPDQPKDGSTTSSEPESSGMPPIKQ